MIQKVFIVCLVLLTSISVGFSAKRKKAIEIKTKSLNTATTTYLIKVAPNKVIGKIERIK